MRAALHDRYRSSRDGLRAGMCRSRASVSRDIGRGCGIGAGSIRQDGAARPSAKREAIPLNRSHQDGTVIVGSEVANRPVPVTASIRHGQRRSTCFCLRVRRFSVRTARPLSFRLL
jgi:hypothetical protein